ncbi:MAG: cobyrinate a,c-diamide synthase [Lachnospiraceae bacterium]|nr:cobyrinate a,c-diamide synthase [Lachnospiraceae bacterium]
MIPGILFAAASSGCGKTTITCGALRAWQRKGLKIKAWKCGPDYIDPMFHKQVLGIPGGNLDSFFLSKEALKAQYQQKNAGFDLAVMEGVMGYYDGLGGISTQASTYEVAQAVDVPVILILDGKGVSLSLAAMLRGFLQYQKDSHIVGVILNRTSPMIGARLKPVLEAEGVKYLGCVPVSKEIQFDSRHLGLVMPVEVPQIQKQLDEIADLLEKSVDLDGILELARSYAEKVENNADAGLAKCQTSRVAMETPAAGLFTESRNPLRIAVARDEAFCFYYQENMELLESLGVELIPFSPIHDQELPAKVSGVILGGGYPENYAKALSENTSMLASIRQAWENKMPFLAECGGFLYLHQELEGSDGIFYPLAGVIPDKAWKTNRLGRFGYITLTPDHPDTCLIRKIKGHEFHYWESGDSGTCWRAKKPLSDRSWSCIHSEQGQIAGFPHLYYPSAPEFAEQWLGMCRKWSRTVS